MSLVWAAFVLFPIADAIGTRGSTLDHVVALTCATAFVGCYVALILSMQAGPWASWVRVVLLAAMFALAAVLTLAIRPSWGYLFCYCAACSSLLSSGRLVFVGNVLSTSLAAVLPAVAGANAGTALGLASSAAGVGLLMVLIRDLRIRNLELTAARAQLAQQAVTEERERFARDLHDLLGHSLSVIAIKAELAGRLLSVDRARAATEVADIESVAREALGEVREAVSGYSQPTLEGELVGARVALNAAGVECEIDHSAAELCPDAEAVFAWAVREGATNVIRHSNARHCTMRFTTGPGAAVLEVVDDGTAAGDGSVGNGLTGLRERARAVRGTITAGPQAGGGYRLAVSVPNAGVVA
jgi:two-component system, NarL family, sensor histidine kinase DesK